MLGDKRGREERKCDGSSEMIKVAEVPLDSSIHMIFNTHDTFLHHLHLRLVTHLSSRAAKNTLRPSKWSHFSAHTQPL